jgi:hypothetical protein
MLPILINNKHLEREREIRIMTRSAEKCEKIKKKKRRREERTNLVLHRTGAHR